MGCDIHLVLERRHHDKWVGVDTFEGHHRVYVKKGEYDYSTPAARSRNYERFARLAGVRGDGPEPKGVPDDASDTTRALAEYWDSDGHSYSWLPLNEAARIWLETQQEPTDWAVQYPESYFFNVDVSEGSRNVASDFRVVFWFDN